ncbi:hypothetical protein Kpol_1076p6 [Vanderwaltozyma polyspora DSM 70294]|uniref:Small ribosomal subunit protein uS11m n=1 Tax=Vanderwaltozyma polyspora (strain ATCC 22028 / DSM 70294 / BCRC 21397 / CBS 2163 / NBRC 10782 / NRRL Y-8283 / UCD 57-17) TaxID=436907 RepID=A7TSF7_VANPO|nr:uncharacterized protein Kpol_1076p6 [Vanderwaltozyma polyspora DSM 70294]EDO14800.1 hypothetical protein Kpol_1076p6 [Vanderwaltozyma polyspora DSM 70294]
MFGARRFLGLGTSKIGSSKLSIIRDKCGINTTSIRSIGNNSLSFSHVVAGNSKERELTNVVGVSKTNLKPVYRTVKYVLTCVFGKNNTHITYSAVVEDINYMKRQDTSKYNEAFLYYMKLPQKVKFNISTGCLGFRKAARGEYEAAFQTSAKAFQMIQEKNLLDKNIEIVMKDFGKGRAAFIAALTGKEGNGVRSNVTRISDKTALKFGGVRSPRVRRL